MKAIRILKTKALMYLPFRTSLSSHGIVHGQLMSYSEVGLSGLFSCKLKTQPLCDGFQEQLLRSSSTYDRENESHPGELGFSSFQNQVPSSQGPATLPTENLRVHHSKIKWDPEGMISACSLQGPGEMQSGFWVHAWSPHLFYP